MFLNHFLGASLNFAFKQFFMFDLDQTFPCQIFAVPVQMFDSLAMHLYPALCGHNVSES